jgi:transcriptional regulator with PAS, ATPase and Fis domain
MSDKAAENVDPFAFLGTSRAIHRIRREISRAAKSDAKVVVTGESGVGKEIVARRIHALSKRSRVGLVTINCAGVPDTLLEAELFGHVRGSFTGAYRDNPGVLSLADRGTLFMDEVGEMSARMQALLLRFLDTGEIHRVGTNGVGRHVDVRIIAATNRHLPDRIETGEFRSDLYYRLNVIHLHIPPLRERREDIMLLLQTFLRRFAVREGVPVPECRPELLKNLVNYHWPGNVRELRNMAERMILLAGEDVAAFEALLSSISKDEQAAPANVPRPVRSDMSEASNLFHRMVREGEVFWDVVHAPFLARDLTRAEVRRVISQGLRLTHGSYRQLVELFNMPLDDYKRFLNFLRKYDCQLRFQDFRVRLPREEVRAGDLVHAE